jgi:hypothetical protein
MNGNADTGEEHIVAESLTRNEAIKKALALNQQGVEYGIQDIEE